MKHGDFDQDAGEMEMGTCVMDHDREKSDHDLALATSVRPVKYLDLIVAHLYIAKHGPPFHPVIMVDRIISP